MGQLTNIKLPVPAGITAQLVSATLDGKPLLPQTELGPDVVSMADMTVDPGKVEFTRAFKIGDKVGEACVTAFDVPAPAPAEVAVPTPEPITAEVAADSAAATAAAEVVVKEEPAKVVATT